MKIALAILGRLFGMFWLVFGMNGLFHVFPIPAPPAESAFFMEALEKAGYVMPLTYGLEAVAGVMLLIGAFVPLALVLLAPITFNIVIYDLMLNPDGLAIGIVIAVIHAFLLWKHRASYRPMLSCQCMG